jgi:aerobic-type carbon monoxide dehydrogenase small subunit (CoxS/CutS family)
VDGKAIRSCQARIDGVADKPIRTVEGLAAGDKLHPVQKAFLDAGSMQCGYCTPGMVMAAVALLERQPDPTRDDILAEMNGNVCRCGTYVRLVAAIEAAAKAMKGGAK